MDPQNGQTLAEVESNYELAVSEAHAHHICVFCATWAPESISGLAELETAERSQLNQWILNSGVCDDTVDWATVLGDPNVPQRTTRCTSAIRSTPTPPRNAAMVNATPVKRWFEAGSYP
jgi:hypothetical protein